MKTLITFFILFFSVQSLAQLKNKDIRFECKTEMPTTTFVGFTKGNELILTTIHHNGVKFMPIHEGIVVPSDLNYLKEKSSILTQMSDRNEFRFPIEKCRIDGSQQLTCTGGNTQNFANYEMRGLLLYTSKIRESAFGQNFDQLRVTLSVQILNYAPAQDISMRYQPQECYMNF